MCGQLNLKWGFYFVEQTEGWERILLSVFVVFRCQFSCYQSSKLIHQYPEFVHLRAQY